MLRVALACHVVHTLSGSMSAILSLFCFALYRSIPCVRDRHHRPWLASTHGHIGSPGCLQVGHMKYELLFKHNFCIEPYICTQRTPEGSRVIDSMNMGYDIQPTLAGFELAICSVTRSHRFH